MTLNELNSYHSSLITAITTEDQNINRVELLKYVLPGLNESRLIDSAEVTEAYYSIESENIEIDAYLINETGERLQLFLSNLVLPGSADINIPRKDYYDTFFLKVKNFVTKAIKNQLTQIQAGDPASVLIKFLESIEFYQQIDVIEIFLISNTISIETRGNQSPKNFTFTDDKITLKRMVGFSTVTKVFKIKYQLIDLNRIYNSEISAGNSEPIVIKFDPFLPAIKAADDKILFESYLAVIPAKMLIDFYHDYSSRLLERNVRSFLQFKGVNKQLKDTITGEPEKFIAYNNGLTITATASEIETTAGLSKIHSLTNFQIVNGGQTTASIYFSYKDGIDVSNVNVIAKINIVKSEDQEKLDELISNISKYSNSQSRVSNVDLNSRSAHLVKIKKLSESITDSSGSKWYFERVRGEFNTLLRIHPGRKNQIERNYPKAKRLSKEQVAKYYVAWGTSPYLVRKGGEKVFRDFMNFIQFDFHEKPLNPESLGRSFYEDLIAKAILFKEFETLYGSGPNAIGQIRSSVVPYALSVLYKLTLIKKINYFDLGTIWMAQALPDDLKEFSKKLLKSVHEWCKKYSESDDVGEYAKKDILWKKLISSREFTTLENDVKTKVIINKYRLSETNFRKRYTVTTSFDFSLINENCRIHSNGAEFYLSLKLQFSKSLTTEEKRGLKDLVLKIEEKQNLESDVIEFENKTIKRLQVTDPEWFSESMSEGSNLIDAIGYITNVYNKNLLKVKAAFASEAQKAIKKGIAKTKANSFENIGISLAKNENPLIIDIYKVGEVLKKIQ